jgi:hypothetical protein
MHTRSSLARDFFASGLRNEGRAREPSRRSCIIDLVDKRLVERNIDSDCPPGVGKQRNSKQNCSCFNGRLDIFVAQDCVDKARCRQLSARAFQCFGMLTQSHRRVRHCFFQGLARRKASFNVRKPDAKSTVGILFNYSHVVRRHCHRASLQLPSGAPAGQLVNSARQPDWQIPSWMSHCDNFFPLRMLEGVVIAVHPIKHPSVLLQHSDQLAAVSFHCSRPISLHGSIAADTLCPFGRPALRSRATRSLGRIVLTLNVCI